MSGRYTFANYNIRFHLFCACAAVAHSIYICWPASVLSGLNINYMMFPPKPIRMLGVHYRKVVSTNKPLLYRV